MKSKDTHGELEPGPDPQLEITATFCVFFCRQIQACSALLCTTGGRVTSTKSLAGKEGI